MGADKTAVRVRVVTSFLVAIAAALAASVISQRLFGASELVSYVVLGLTVPIAYELMMALLQRRSQA